MNDPGHSSAGARLLASGSGVGIYEQGERLLVVDRRTGSLYVAAFVLALLAFVAAVNGVIQMALSPRGEGSLGLGLVMLSVGGLAAVPLYAVVDRIKRRHRQGPTAARTVAVFDLAAGELRDGAGRALAPLGQVRLRRRMQLGSSSPKLVAEWGGERLLLARGNPFAGGIAELEDALRRRGLMAER